MTEQNKYVNQKPQVTHKPIQGFKNLSNCIVQSYTDMLKGKWKEYDHCYAKLTIDPGNKIYEPVSGYEISTESYHIDEIRTIGGCMCKSAKTPMRSLKSITQKPQTIYKCTLDTNPSTRYSEGLYYFPTEELCHNDEIKNNNYTEYSFFGLYKKRHQSNIKFQYNNYIIG